MMKWMFWLFPLLTLSGALAAPVGSSQARMAVKNWLRIGDTFSCPLGTEVESSKVCKTEEGDEFHVVKLKGRGFVVTSADTRIEPIIAFSSAENLIEDDRNPLWCLLKGDLAARGKAMKAPRPLATGPQTVNPNEKRWDRLLKPSPKILGTQNPSDVRVAPLIRSQWSQGSHNNYSDPNHENKCYNYYTPNNWPCGCVATAGAQIMRYHRYPTTKVTAGTYECSAPSPVYLTMQGGTYDWDKMPLVPAKGVTEEQRQAIGKLTSDLGISCCMSYGERGSSAGPIDLSTSLVDRFHYSNAKYVYFNSGSTYPFPYSLERLKKALIPNLDARLPVEMGVSGDGGHAIIADGYGYDKNQFYIHVNLGWAGMDDAWYLPPDIQNFNAIDNLIYNIYPTQTKNASIVSGRVLSEQGSAPMKNVTVSTTFGGKTISCKTDDKGIYALILPVGTYALTADNGVVQKEMSIRVSECSSLPSAGNGNGFSVTPQSIGNLPDQNFTLTEVPPPPSVVEERFQMFSKAGGEKSVRAAEAWTARKEASASWLTLSKSSGKAGEMISFSAQENATGKGRSATITVSSATGGYANTLTVVQSSLPWVFSKADAFTAARQEKKRIFLLSGHEDCEICYGVYYLQCESLEDSDGVKTLLKNGYILWMNDLDDNPGDAADYLTDPSSTVHPHLRIIDIGTPQNPLAEKEGKPQQGELEDWLVENGVTHSTEGYKVPYSWIRQNTTVTGFDFESAAWADDDNDGFDNWKEYLTGTNPQDPGSKLHCSIKIINGQIQLSYSYGSNEHVDYIFEGKEKLSDPEWKSPLTGYQHFFRVRAVPKK